MKHLKKSVLILLAMIFALGMIMAGCGSSDAGDASAASDAGSAAAVSDEDAAAAVDELIAAIKRDRDGAISYFNDKERSYENVR